MDLQFDFEFLRLTVNIWVQWLQESWQSVIHAITYWKPSDAKVLCCHFPGMKEWDSYLDVLLESFCPRPPQKILSGKAGAVQTSLSSGLDTDYAGCSFTDERIV